MFSRTMFVLALALVVVGTTGAKPPADRLEPARQLGAAYNRFGIKLFKEIGGLGQGENTFISPTSAAVALAMVYSGVSGETRREMAEVLELTGMTAAEVNEANGILRGVLERAGDAGAFRMANSLWLRNEADFVPGYLERVKVAYEAETGPLDAGLINSWVSDRTEGKIPRIIDRISDNDLLVLINAIYFKAAWQREFDPALTEDGDFHLLSGETKQHPLMSISGKFVYGETDGFQAIRLPYRTGRLAMYVFLPSRELGLERFLERLSVEKWDGWLAQMQKTKGDLKLPKFKLEYKKLLNEALVGMGMVSAFDPQGADFSELCRQQVFLSRVLQKTFVEVNEQGTEAVAATSATIALTAAPMQPPPVRFEIIVDRPFFCAIVDETSGSMLFVGAIVDP